METTTTLEGKIEYAAADMGARKIIAMVEGEDGKAQIVFQSTDKYFRKVDPKKGDKITVEIKIEK